jgi:hypothetical protein
MYAIFTVSKLNYTIAANHYNNPLKSYENGTI